MEQLVTEMELFSDLTSTFNVADIFLSMLFSFISALIIGWVYKKTHIGVSYSRTFVQTLVIMEITISVIMLIIGSNIARAFSLVGALSIIRFRTAVKDSRDVSFIFFSMAAGMAFGTRFYLLGGIFTIVMCIFVYIMYIMKYGSRTINESILKIIVPSDFEHEILEKLLVQVSKEYNLLSMDSVSLSEDELVYLVEFKNKISRKNVIEKIKTLNSECKVSIVETEHNIDI